jgi:DNA-binding response OmpR family regulator
MIKVMLIEDDQDMVSLLKMFLDLEGYLVKTPTNHDIDALLKIIKKEHPEIILVDVNLRQGNGLDLLREIRQRKDIKNIRVIMYSGLDVREQCIQAGADDFILKPFIPDELIKLIQANTYPKKI